MNYLTGLKAIAVFVFGVFGNIFISIALWVTVFGPNHPFAVVPLSMLTVIFLVYTWFWYFISKTRVIKDFIDAL